MLRYSALCVSAELISQQLAQKRCKKKKKLNFRLVRCGVLWCDRRRRVGVLTFELLWSIYIYLYVYIDNLTFINLFYCAKNKKKKKTFNNIQPLLRMRVGVIPIKTIRWLVIFGFNRDNDLCVVRFWWPHTICVWGQ